MENKLYKVEELDYISVDDHFKFIIKDTTTEVELSDEYKAWYKNRFIAKNEIITKERKWFQFWKPNLTITVSKKINIVKNENNPMSENIKNGLVFQIV